MLSGCDAVRIDYSQQLDGQTYQCREAMLETDRGIVWIFFSSTGSIGLKAFEKVIGSIETL